MKMHELMDREYPTCLYCNSQCEIFYSGTTIPHTNMTVDHESLLCTSCKETFIIDSTQSLDGETIYTGFGFTCKIYIVKFHYVKDNFEIWYGNKFITAIPPFKVNFSDKEKLHEKLKTYIIFS